METPQNSETHSPAPVTRSQIHFHEDPLDAESLQDQSTGAGTGTRDDDPLEIRRGPGRPKGSRNKRKELEPPKPNSNQIDLTTGPSTRSRTGGGSAHAHYAYPGYSFPYCLQLGVDDDPDVVPITYAEAITGTNLSTGRRLWPKNSSLLIETRPGD